MSKKQVVPYKNNRSSKKKQVRQMFDSISARYDIINRIISGGLDLKWRKNVVKVVKHKRPKRILDVATGTGDLAIALGKTLASEIIGIDISKQMLEIGKKKVEKNQLQKNIKMEIGDGENINYPNNYFDAVTVSFGVRNFENLDKGLLEIYRVLKPGSKLVILETSIPQSFPLNCLYHLYTLYFLPLIGSFFSKDKSAYKYLSSSAKSFPFGKAFNKILKKNGFVVIDNIPQSFGVASIYHSQKPLLDV